MAGRARAALGLGAGGERAAGACQLCALLDAGSRFCHGAQVIFWEMANESYFRGTSLIRNSAPLGPYSTTMPRALWWS